MSLRGNYSFLRVGTMVIWNNPLSHFQMSVMQRLKINASNLKWINPGWARVPLEVGPEAEVLQICLRQWLVWFIVQLFEPPRERTSSHGGLDIGVCCCIWLSVKGVRLPQVGEEREGWWVESSKRSQSQPPCCVTSLGAGKLCSAPSTRGTMQGVEQRGGVVGMTFRQGCEASSMQHKDGKRKIS